MTYPDDFINKIICGDCLEIMKQMPDKCVDLILCDLPYGTTQCRWDSILPFDELWKQYERVSKKQAHIVLTSSQPFTTKLINSNMCNFKYSWVWDKGSSGNIFLAKYQPMKVTEDICVFYGSFETYYPIKVKGNPRRMINNGMKNSAFGDFAVFVGTISTERNPVNLIYFPNTDRKNIQHPTQKPINLFLYLIQTYTLKNAIVLDNCMGSGTTAVACKELSRNFIGIEINQEYCDIATKRLFNTQGSLF